MSFITFTPPRPAMLNRRLGGAAVGLRSGLDEAGAGGQKLEGRVPAPHTRPWCCEGSLGQWDPPQDSSGQGPGPAEPPALQSPRPHRHHPGVAQGLRIFCLGNANLTFQL